MKGIVDNQEIWHTSVLHLNDPSEVDFGIEATKKELDAIVSQSGGDSFLKEFCRHVEFLITHNRHNVFGFFVASFSRAADELGQWRGYGDNGHGFAVALNARLFQTTDTLDPTQPEKNVFVTPVSYGELNTRRMQNTALHRALDITRKIIADKAGRILMIRNENEFLSELCMELSVPLLWNNVTTKHDAYKAEREVRQIILGHLPKFKSIETRIRKGELIPFIRRPISTHKRGDIVKVVVGPAAGPTAVDGVENLLRTRGIDPTNRVTRSKIPYRG